MSDNEKAKNDFKGSDMSAGSELWKPQLPQPGPETVALKRFHVNSTWTGTVKADGMGPGLPEMVGKGTFKWIMDGLRILGNFEQDQFIADKKVLTWKCHYIAGWNYITQDYRAFAVDNNGNSSVLNGDIEGDKFILTSEAYTTPDSQSVQLRMIWDLTDPNAMKWLNESSVNGEPWTLMEEYVCTPLE